MTYINVFETNLFNFPMFTQYKGKQRFTQVFIYSTFIYSKCFY